MYARLKSALQPLRIYRAARFGWHFTRDPVFRRDHLLLWRRPPNLFQHRSMTWPHRYPVIFGTLRDRLAHRDGASLRLLSFGSAMGDEVFSLREYFPAAAIKGLDINPANIAEARRRREMTGGDQALEFEVADSTATEPAEGYHAVFCMAVFTSLRLKEDPAMATSEPYLRFADFARTTAGLAAAVRPGGYLVIRHAMFRFTDTKAATGFRPVFAVSAETATSPCFDRANRRLPDEPTELVIFEKLPG